jgi:hypothetical protein
MNANENESDDELTPTEEAEHRQLRLALRASYGFPYAVKAFAREPDVPDWLWRVVIVKAASTLFDRVPKRAQERYLRYRFPRETRGRPRKLDAEFLAAVESRRANGLSEADAVSEAIDDHNKAHPERRVDDDRTGTRALGRARRSSSR